MSRTKWIFIVVIAVSFSCQTKPTPPQTSNISSVPTPTAETRPMLAAVVKSVSLYPVPGQAGNLAISLVVSVSNSALPSTASNWNVEVFSGVQSETREPVRVNGVVELPGTSRTVDLSKDDLAVKTAETPISKTAPVDGVLTFVIPQTSERDLIAKKTSLRVHFKDAAGNSYQTERVVVGKKASGK